MKSSPLEFDYYNIIHIMGENSYWKVSEFCKMVAQQLIKQLEVANQN